ncbi:MAG TPA: ROK family protein [Jatrophihabitans sp.]|jgi:glucokinase|nr:ROK family protein [Jatrophihabitans sp.]
MRSGSARPVLEVGGTHVTAAWVDPVGWQVSGQRRYSLQADAGGEQLLAELAAAGAELAAGPGARWGIALPGPFDYQAGVAHYTGVAKFEGLTGLDVRSALCELLPGRPGAISFVNDASAFLIGEWLVGAAAGAHRCAALTLGTGIGSAFCDDGRVVDTGPTVPPQAEVHLLQHAGRPLEDWVSRRALRAEYARQRPGEQPDVRELAELARSGDGVALAVFGRAFEILGQVVGPWLDRFGADQLVIGGSISGAWDLIEAPLRNGLSTGSDCRYAIAVAARPELAPLVGAGYAAG